MQSSVGGFSLVISWAMREEPLTCVHIVYTDHPYVIVRVNQGENRNN